MDVRLPDGTILRNVPEGTTKAQIMAKVGLSAEQPQQPQQEGPSMLSQIGRQAALTARAPIAAALSPFAMAGDLVTGGKSSPAVETVLNAIFPKPENATERFAQDVAGAMAGGAGLAGATGTMATALPQILSAAGGAAGASGAREMGVGPVGQFVAGLGGGVVAPSMGIAATEGAKAAGRAARGLVEPFTEAGRKNIVARTLQSQAQDPRAAADRLQQVQEFVPGSLPTTAEAAQDIGLSALQKAVRNQNPADFADRAAAQNAARQTYLTKALGTQADVDAMIAQRTADTQPLRESALANANASMAMDTRDLQAAIERMRNAPGKRSSDVVQKALTAVQEKIASLSDQNGLMDARDLYTIRKELGTTIQQYSKETQNWDKRLTAGLENSVKGYIDLAITKAGGTEWKDYLKKYAEATGNIESKKTAQDIAARSVNASTERLSGPQFARNMAGLDQQLNPADFSALSNVNADLKRSMAPEAAMRAQGSDTLQNMVGANMLRSAGMNAGPARIAAGLMGKVYGPLEAQTQGLLGQAMLDPGLGAELLSMQITKDPRFAEGLLRRLLVVPGSGLLGTGIAK